MGIIWLIIVGLIAGLIARAIMPGPDPIGWVMTILLGIAGSFVGNVICGALGMGLRHGSFCTGCCWLLMALLVVAGVMNVLWVATITAFVLIEKIAPRGDVVGRVAGVVLVLAGLMMLSQAWH